MKIIKIILFLLISFNTSLKANSEDNVQNILNEGGKLIFIRHAYAPGGGDPDNFNLSNCESQRNLNEEGIKQAMKIGNFFLERNIIIDKRKFLILWCTVVPGMVLVSDNYTRYDTVNYIVVHVYTCHVSYMTYTIIIHTTCHVCCTGGVKS
jgi:hypothetical protein